MRRLISTITLVLLLMNIGFANEKDIIKRSVKLPSFDKVDLIGSFDVDIYKDSTYKGIIYASNSDIEKVGLEVINNTLYIRLKPEYKHVNKVKIFLSTNNLTAVNLIGCGDIDIKSPFVTDKSMKIDLKGSGDIEATSLQAKQVSINLSGSGDIDIKSLSSDNVSANLAGSGDIKINKCNCIELKTNSKGSGDIDVKNITAKFINSMSAGNSDITLDGKAEDAIFKTFGSGSIKAQNLLLDNLNAIVTGSGGITCNANKLERNGSDNIKNCR